MCKKTSHGHCQIIQNDRVPNLDIRYRNFIFQDSMTESQDTAVASFVATPLTGWGLYWCSNISPR